MFLLKESDLNLRIVGCGDGPASFNSTLSKRGGSVVSIDPLYIFNAEQIRGRIAETYETVLDQMRQNRGDYVWEMISSVEELARVRKFSMDEFLTDYEAGKKERRYLAGELPSLPLKPGQFDLALCSHFLFLYSAHLTVKFHLDAIRDMLRVATEVRVFPLLTLNGTRSPHADHVIEALNNAGLIAEIRRVPYEFQRGGNEMLLVKRA